MNVPERMTGAVEATEEKLKNYYQNMIYTKGPEWQESSADSSIYDM